MYSIVLMAATAAGPTTPAADATPVVVAAPAVGCCGGTIIAGCTGCTGYAASCYGCYGSCHGVRAPLFHRHKSTCSGYGGCCGGWSCYGSWASCYGCYGACWGSYSYGCWGSCYGSYSYGCGGCWGANYGCSGYAAPAVVIPVEPAAPATPPAAAPKGTDPKGADPKGADPKSGASLRFQLPPAATLYVDGQRAAGEGADRAFYTPPLQAGQRYFYDVRAEFVVNGQTVVEEKRVIVTAGVGSFRGFTLSPGVAAANNSPFGTHVAGRPSRELPTRGKDRPDPVG